MLTAPPMITTPICRLAPDLGDRQPAVWRLMRSFLGESLEHPLNQERPVK
jgi:hypothetical protein